MSHDVSLVFATEHDAQTGIAEANSYIVAFRNKTPGSGLFFPNYRREYQAHFLALNKFYRDARVKNLHILSAVPLGSQQQLFWKARFAGPNTLPNLNSAFDQNQVAVLTRVDFVNQGAAETALKLWARQKDILFAEPNYISQVFQDTPCKNVYDCYAQEYTAGSADSNIEAIGLLEAYNHIASKNLADDFVLSNTPIIAIMDSGVNYEHAVFENRIWKNPAVNQLGCHDDLYGCNTTVQARGVLGDGNVHPFSTEGPNQSCSGQDADTLKNCNHGTQVASIAVGNHTAGIQGVCPTCEAMILKVVSTTQTGGPGILDSSIVGALTYVSRLLDGERLAVRVLNASFGKYVRSKAVSIFVRLLTEAGTVVVAAAGNEDSMTMNFPAALTEAIAVSSIDPAVAQYPKTDHSNFGRWVDIAAPGQAIRVANVVSTGEAQGTSHAAPHVAGAIGVMLSVEPNMNQAEIRRWLLQTTSLIYSPDDNPYNHDYYYPKLPNENIRVPLLGSGLLSVAGAVKQEEAQGIPTYSALDRVTSQCGNVGDNKTAHNNVWLWLLLPFAIVALQTVTQARNIAKSPI